MLFLQASVQLRTPPKIGATFVYDVRGREANGTLFLDSVVTERIDAVRPDGTIEASRRYSGVAARGQDPDGGDVSGMRALEGRTFRLLVGRDGLWVPKDGQPVPGLIDVIERAGPLRVGDTWTVGRVKDAVARVTEIRPVAGHRAIVIGFVPDLEKTEGERTLPNTVTVLSLEDGRPLYFRLGVLSQDGRRMFTFTTTRRGVRGLDREIARL